MPMSLELKNPNGQAICFFEDWLPLAHPPDAAAKWRDFQSAKEFGAGLFPDWLSFGSGGDVGPA